MRAQPQWVLWHPHQKLWNWSLVSAVRRTVGYRPAQQAAIVALIGADSAMLVARVLWRRLRRETRAATRSAGEERPRVLYIDCGVHKHGEQIRWMHRWFGDRFELHILGFEASAEHIRDARAALGDLDFDLVQLHHAALVGPDHVGEEVRLYKEGNSGKGDSLFAARGQEYEVVPARRLSDVLAAGGHELAGIPAILRMNIEGAERGVIEDLIAAGLDGCIDGYYGMWDDLSKIDPTADREFRRLLGEHRISTITFNDRDLVSVRGHRLSVRLRGAFLRLRRRAIRADIETSVRAGLARTQSTGAGTPQSTGAGTPANLPTALSR
jgi:FkbM family methyltransferase